MAWRSIQTDATGSVEGATVMVADDDRHVRKTLERALRLEGYEVSTVCNGAEVLSSQATSPTELLLLDVSMPNVDGITVCKKLRSDGFDKQIMIISARNAVADRVAGLDAGADDYLVKPFALDELLARVRARINSGRRNRIAHSPRLDQCHSPYMHPLVPVGLDEPGLLKLADLTIDVTKKQVRRAGHLIDLTATEFKLLLFMVRNTDNVVSREDIYEHVWETKESHSEKLLDCYIKYVRTKTEAGGRSRLIHTVRGFGYVARPDTNAVCYHTATQKKEA